MKHLLYTDEQGKFIISDYNIDKILYLLIDRYSFINLMSIEWHDNKKRRHRNYNLPALIYKIQIYSKDTPEYIYSFYWYKNNKQIK